MLLDDLRWEIKHIHNCLIHDKCIEIIVLSVTTNMHSSVVTLKSLETKVGDHPAAAGSLETRDFSTLLPLLTKFHLLEMKQKHFRV